MDLNFNADTSDVAAPDTSSVTAPSAGLPASGNDMQGQASSAASAAFPTIPASGPVPPGYSDQGDVNVVVAADGTVIRAERVYRAMPSGQQE